MKVVNISFHSMNNVKSFMEEVGHIEGDVFLCAGKYFVNAKSIMGIFSLDLSKPLKLKIEQWKEEYMVLLKKYLDE